MVQAFRFQAFWDAIEPTGRTSITARVHRLDDVGDWARLGVARPPAEDALDVFVHVGVTPVEVHPPVRAKPLNCVIKIRKYMVAKAY